MQACKVLKRLPVITTQKAIFTRPKRNMAFFPRGFIGNDATTSFAPLFRFLDDFDSYNNRGSSSSRNTTANRLISPKFDVRESAEAYELHGEFPGLAQENISLEFTDAQTLTVRAHSEREYSTTNPSAIEGGKAAGAITEGNGHDDAASTKPHNPTVEDEDKAEGALLHSADKGQVTTRSKSDTTQSQAQAQTQRPTATYHAYERSVGDYYRQFSFPGRIDQEAVKASMKNGILSVIVPKAKKHEAKKIVIQ